MPFINFIYSSAIQKDAEIALALTQIINEKLGKPIDYICVNVIYNPNLFFAGTNKLMVLLLWFKFKPLVGH